MSGDDQLLESEIAEKIQLEASKFRIWLGRNNSGSLMNHEAKPPRPVRFGLGNISKKVQENFRSSDFVGIFPVVITPDMVGKTVGVFVASETKRPGYPKDARYRAQKAFIDFIKNNGGIADFNTSAEDFSRMVKNWFGRS